LIYLVLSLIWLAASGLLFTKTTPEGLPVFTIPLGNPPLNGAWLAVAFAVYNAVRFYQYINQKNEKNQRDQTDPGNQKKIP
jgi:hypothetical protein